MKYMSAFMAISQKIATNTSALPGEVYVHKITIGTDVKIVKVVK